MPELPNVDELCGRHFVYRDFIECGQTWKTTRVDNTPKQQRTFQALLDLSLTVLDPIVDKYGPIKLTHGFTSLNLIRKISKGVAPKIDQHASYEVGKGNELICSRGGAACDFLVEGVGSDLVAIWMVRTLGFDRIYYYGNASPIHVSIATKPVHKCVVIRSTKHGHRYPVTYTSGRFVEIVSGS